jgi:hypothetical protein
MPMNPEAKITRATMIVFVMKLPVSSLAMSDLTFRQLELSLKIGNVG